MKLVIGNKRYSSWSMRPWVLMKAAGLAFDEEVIGLDLPDTAANIRRVSPSGRVPCLIDGANVVWDSLAIAEYLAETSPGLWPADRARRARARSVSAEMHSGFVALRTECPMKILETFERKPLREDTQADIARILEIWNQCLGESGGPFLFGAHFGIADAMYTPVVTRFRTYSVPLDGRVRAYADAIWTHPAVQEWVEGARNETLRAKRYE